MFDIPRSHTDIYCVSSLDAVRVLHQSEGRTFLDLALLLSRLPAGLRSPTLHALFPSAFRTPSIPAISVSRLSISDARVGTSGIEDVVSTGGNWRSARFCLDAVGSAVHARLHVASPLRFYRPCSPPSIMPVRTVRFSARLDALEFRHSTVGWNPCPYACVSSLNFYFIFAFSGSAGSAPLSAGIVRYHRDFRSSTSITSDDPRSLSLS
jgi:hypothetical protein